MRETINLFLGFLVSSAIFDFLLIENNTLIQDCFKGFTYLIRDSNLSKSFLEDHPLCNLISNIQNISCKWVLSCSTQTVCSFDGRIFYKKTLAIRTVVVFQKFLFCLSEFQRKRVFSCHEESYRIGHNQMVKALALWKPALFVFS